MGGLCFLRALCSRLRAGIGLASGETQHSGPQLTILSPASESDGNPTTEDESSRSPEDLERGAAPVAAEAPAQGSIFLAGAAPPAPCPASSSILVNGSFLAAGSSPAVLLNGSPVIINSLALGEASSLGPLLLGGGGGAPAPQPSPQGASEGKTSLVLDPQTGEVRLEEAQPEAPETKGAQVAASGPPGEEVPGPLPQVVPGPPPAATFPLPPGPVTSVAAPQVVPLSPPPGYPAGLGPTSPLLNLPQVVPTSQVVTLPQAVGPLQLLAAGPGSPVKVAAAPGPANVHLINSGVGVTALQLPSATAPGTPFWWLGGGYSYLREGWRCQWASWGNGGEWGAHPGWVPDPPVPGSTLRLEPRRLGLTLTLKGLLLPLADLPACSPAANSSPLRLALLLSPQETSCWPTPCLAAPS